MASTQAMAASPEPANWPLSPPDWSLPIEPPGLVGGGSAPPGRFRLVSMGIIGADALLEELDELVDELVLAAVVVSSPLRSRKNSRTPTRTRTGRPAVRLHGRGLLFGGCPSGP